MLSHEHIRARFLGALLGTFTGDALGMPVEGRPAKAVAHRHGLLRELVGGRLPAGSYTDDTEMTLVLAESLVALRGFHPDDFASRLAATADPDRGYGAGTSDTLDRIRRGVAWSEAAKRAYGHGSFGNGAAVRVSPVGLLYHRRLDVCVGVARTSSQVTHAHALGKAGAAMQAAGVALALRWATEEASPIDAGRFLAALVSLLEDREGLFAECLEKVGMMLTARGAPPLEAPLDERAEWADHVSGVLGADARAFESVPSALYLLLAYPQSLEAALVGAVSLGGDTDSIAAMTGALAGAYHGVEAIPGRWLDALERGPRGYHYAAGLADDLFLLWLERESDSPLDPVLLP